MSTPRITDLGSALHYGDTILRGNRVTLRAVTQEDLNTLAGWWQLSDWAILQQGSVKPQSHSAITEMFSQWSTNDTAGSVGLSIDDEAGELIGHTTLWGGSLPVRAATFAIIIGPPFIGKGYGTDATKTMLRYGFEELGLHKIELQAWAFNTRGLRAYERAGFVKEGVRRAAVFHGGEFHDQVLMSLLEEEYRALPR